MKTAVLCMMATVLLAAASIVAAAANRDMTSSDVTSASQSGDVWMVRQFAGDKDDAADAWEKTAEALAGIVNVGSKSADSESVSFYAGDGSDAVAYTGKAHTAKDYSTFAFNQVKDVVRKRLGIAAKDSKKAPPAEKKEEKKEAPKAAGGVAPAGKVAVLTADNFDVAVLKSDDVWLVEFYAPWCGHCKNLAPEWKKAAKQLKETEGVRLGMVDATVHKALGQQYDVNGYPTIKVFGADKTKPADFQGGRQAPAIVAEAKKLAGGGGDAAAAEEDDADSNVVKLTSATFDETVLASKDLWMVEFYAPWCGHCKKLAPEWSDAADMMLLEHEDAHLAAVDCTQHKDVCSRYGANSYPTIKVFGMGDKSGEDYVPAEYEGGRVSSSIIEFMEAELKPAPTVVELTSPDVYEKECAPAGALCVVAVLPHILDTGADGRNAHIAMLQSLSQEFKSKSFSYVWSEAMQQNKMEDALNIGGAGYPALVVVNNKKLRTVPFYGAFNRANIAAFMQRLHEGKERSFPISAAPTIKTTTAWNGKDGELPKEEL